MLLVIYVSLWPLVVCPMRVPSDDTFDTDRRGRYVKLKYLARAEVCRKLGAHGNARCLASSVTHTEDFGQVRTITPALERLSLETSRDQMTKGHGFDGSVVVMEADETIRDGFQYLPPYEEVETVAGLS